MSKILPDKERSRRLKARLDSILGILKEGPATAKKISSSTGLDQSTIHRLCRNYLILKGKVGTEKTRGDLARIYYLKKTNV